MAKQLEFGFNYAPAPYKSSTGIERTAFKEFAGVKNKIKGKNKNKGS